VLVVDDSLSARRMLTIAIGDAGYRVRTAIDGRDAVEAIEEAVPDLLITDLEMPRMNGLELAGYLRADDATAAVPILMVTSRSTDKHRGQAQTAGINDFITKPYSNQDLLDVVARLLGEEFNRARG
jgi:CheY-like chemotaxis protein